MGATLVVAVVVGEQPDNDLRAGLWRLAAGRVVGEGGLEGARGAGVVADARPARRGLLLSLHAVVLGDLHVDGQAVQPDLAGAIRGRAAHLLRQRVLDAAQAGRDS